jgi:hypothetical protein
MPWHFASLVLKVLLEQRIVNDVYLIQQKEALRRAGSGWVEKGSPPNATPGVRLRFPLENNRKEWQYDAVWK